MIAAVASALYTASLRHTSAAVRGVLGGRRSPAQRRTAALALGGWSDGVGYGISPGDGFSAHPYAYVGLPGPVDDPFFDAPFGALRTWSQVPDAASVAAFFAEGRQRAAAAAR